MRILSRRCLSHNTKNLFESSWQFSKVRYTILSWDWVSYSTCSEANQKTGFKDRSYLIESRNHHATSFQLKSISHNGCDWCQGITRNVYRYREPVWTIHGNPRSWDCSPSKISLPLSESDARRSPAVHYCQQRWDSAWSDPRLWCWERLHGLPLSH